MSEADAPTLPGLRLCPACFAETADTQCRIDRASTVDPEAARIAAVRVKPNQTVVDGRYAVGGVIGSGSFGKVYAAVNLRNGVSVALKVFDPSSSTSLTALKRFCVEGRASASLRHPNIVSLIDFGQSPDGVLYIAMELLRGHTLRSDMEVRAAEGRTFDEVEILNIAEGVACALTEAHAQGIVHRDLKPANIIVDHLENGEENIKILDFGIAKDLHAHYELTGDRRPIGTPKYMSPEQVRGELVDGRSDLYNLGMILYELVAGRHPFATGDPTSTMKRQALEAVPPLSPDLPYSAGLVSLIERATRKSAALRQSSAKAFLDEVRKLQSPTATARDAPLTDEGREDQPTNEAEEPEVGHKWSILSLLALGELLVMSLWFSASAVLPQLSAEWSLSSGQQSWMTMSVQIGFVVGAVASALTNLADRIRPERLIAASAILGAVFNGAIVLFAEGPVLALPLRFLTGVTLAGVYPPGMKLMATWCRQDRGLGMGLLIGALTVGSASPHLFNALQAQAQELASWKAVLGTSSGCALAGALIVGSLVQSGPYLVKAARFSWRQAGRGLADRPVRLANFGYLGHMWELYAMWAWVPLLLVMSYEAAGLSPTSARIAGFSAVAIGGLGSFLAGRLADRWGRTTLTMASLGVSGACCLVAGAAFDHPLLLTAICLVWGFAVVADSAQFSTAVTELGDPAYVGTALTVQTTLGFLLTLFSIRLVPLVADIAGWRHSFIILVLGPIFGLVSMKQLRGLPEAVKMASGNR